MKARMRRLAKKSQPPIAAMQERWARAAARHLSDDELRLLQSALRRGFDPSSAREQQDVPVAPAQWAAYERFAKFYEEARSEK